MGFTGCLSTITQPEYKYSNLMCMGGMEKRDFFRLEEECRLRFSELGQCYHICTQENHPVIFRNEKEFMAAMNAVALATMLYTDIVLVTFEVMSNHLHFAVAGDKDIIILWFKKIKRLLAVNPLFENSGQAVSSLTAAIHPAKDLEHFRNVIAYINRNGYVVCRNETPFSYKWGANRFYFNPDAKQRHSFSCKKISYREKRSLFHCCLADGIKNVFILDGYVSPLTFCSIETGETLFRDAHHYFARITKNVESNASIAKEIGESLFYTDDDLFSVVRSICSRDYGNPDPALLPYETKLSIARMMHFNYNASNKQVSRVLRINLDQVNIIFPTKR